MRSSWGWLQPGRSAAPLGAATQETFSALIFSTEPFRSLPSLNVSDRGRFSEAA